MTTLSYIVICANVVGSESFETVYSSDDREFDDREAAIDHGFTLGRCDDFNIGVLRDGKLVSVDWMHQTVDASPDVLFRVARYIGRRIN